MGSCYSCHSFFEMVWTTNVVAGLVPNFPAMAYAHIYAYIGPRAILLLSSPPGLKLNVYHPEVFEV